MASDGSLAVLLGAARYLRTALGTHAATPELGMLVQLMDGQLAVLEQTLTGMQPDLAPAMPLGPDALEGWVAGTKTELLAWLDQQVRTARGTV